MDRIHYAGDSILTGTTIAHALLDYAQALSQVGASATVDVPTLNDDGSFGRSEILIGPASQLIASAEDSRYDDVTDEALVAHMVEQAKRLRRNGSPSMSAMVRNSAEPDDMADYDA